MPEAFKRWLETLPDDVADQMWDYFDGSYTVCEDVTAVVCDSHPEIVRRAHGG